MENLTWAYCKPYQYELDDEGEAFSVKLQSPMFRNGGQKKDGVVFNQSKLVGTICDIRFNARYKDEDNTDLYVILLTRTNIVKIEFKAESSLGRQILKRLPAVRLGEKVAISLWSNKEGWPNISMYHKGTELDDKGRPKKDFVKSAYTPEELPEVVDVKLGKKIVKDYSEQVDFLIENVKEFVEGNEQLIENKKLIPQGGDGGSEDFESDDWN